MQGILKAAVEAVLVVDETGTGPGVQHNVRCDRGAINSSESNWKDDPCVLEDGFLPSPGTPTTADAGCAEQVRRRYARCLPMTEERQISVVHPPGSWYSEKVAGVVAG